MRPRARLRTVLRGRDTEEGRSALRVFETGPRPIVAWFAACLGVATPGIGEEAGPTAVPRLPAVSSAPPSAVPLVPRVPLEVSPRPFAEPGALLPTLAREARDDARALMAIGRYQAAHSAWRRAAAASPGQSAVPVEAARRFAAVRLHRVALEWTREARRLEPTREELVVLEAKLILAMDRPDLALASARQTAREGGSAELWAFAAALHAEKGDDERAAEAYEHALAIDAGPSAWWLGFAISAERSQRLVEARDAYRRALRRGLDEPERRFAVGRLNTLLRRDLP